MFTLRNLENDAVSMVNTSKYSFIPQIVYSLNKPSHRYFESRFSGRIPLPMAVTGGLSVRVRPSAVCHERPLSGNEIGVFIAPMLCRVA
jgi:hypothetical protein